MSPEAEPLDLTRILDDLRAAVCAAGAAAMRHFGADPKVWDKPGHGPVSEGDFAANEVLEARLRGAYPDFGWLSEETTDDLERLQRRTVWIVDPIDGTRAFLDGKDEFTICAGLAVEGRSIAGAVYNPRTQELFSAAEGIGAWLGEIRLRIPSPMALDDARFLATRKTWKPEYWRTTVPGGNRGYVNSIAYRICLVAAGRWDACVAVNSFSEWDTAAAQAILQEAGGRISDRNGNALVYNREQTRLPGLIAAHPDLHAAISNRFVP